MRRQLVVVPRFARRPVARGHVRVRGLRGIDALASLGPTSTASRRRDGLMRTPSTRPSRGRRGRTIDGWKGCLWSKSSSRFLNIISRFVSRSSCRCFSSSYNRAGVAAPDRVTAADLLLFAEILGWKVHSSNSRSAFLSLFLRTCSSLSDAQRCVLVKKSRSSRLREYRSASGYSFLGNFFTRGLKVQSSSRVALGRN
jgi:hypothetical protein